MTVETEVKEKEPIEDATIDSAPETFSSGSDEQPSKEQLLEGIKALGEEEKKSETDEKPPEADETDTGEEEEKAEKTDGEEEPDEGLSAELVLEAEALGVSKATIEAFASDEHLRSALEKVYERRSPAKTPADEEKQEDEPPEPEEFKLDLDEDEFDPKLISAVKGMADEINRLRKEQFEQKKTGQGSQEAAQARADMEFVQTFDTMIAELGDAYAPLLGKGTIDTLDPDSPQMKAREDVVDQMNATNASRMRRGEKPLDGKVAFQRAVAAVFPDKTNNIARHDLSDKVKKRGKQIIGRPLSGKKPVDTRTDEDRAVASVGELLDKRGLRLD